MKPLFLLVLSIAALPALGQQSQGHFTFKFNNPQLDPASYIITLDEAGAGHFHSMPGKASEPSDAPLPEEDREIHLSPNFTSQIFSTARQLRFFSVNCEDGKGRIAFQGNKTLAYEGPDGQGSCEFNWSKDVRIQKLADQLMAVATTLTVGLRLESQHQYNHLALDEELQNLCRMTANGQAAEIANISTTLQSIADDESVVDRARRRAKALLIGDKSSLR